MPPKKKKEEEEEEPPPDTPEPPEPEILTKCFRTGSKIFHGACKQGYQERKGTFVRHGFGFQVDAAVAPAGRDEDGELRYEVVVLATYEGHWAEDAMTGTGKYKWSDGSSYEGTLVDGQMHGSRGRYEWPDGSAYEGPWEWGKMHGQGGRLDSKFDGSCLGPSSRFYRNCFQSRDLAWVDIMAKMQQEERQRILRGDPQALTVRRCVCAEALGDRSKQRQLLQSALTGVLSDGLVPFVVAEESLGASVLEFLKNANSTDNASEYVSVRLAAIAKRRARDYHSFFYDAIQSSLRSGTNFVMVFEDDAEGCEMVRDEQSDWLSRLPATGTASSALPNEWRLDRFYDPNVFPVEIFHPPLFNGRGKAKLFLPELTQPSRPAVGEKPPVDAMPEPAERPPSSEKKAGGKRSPSKTRSGSKGNVMEDVAAPVAQEAAPVQMSDEAEAALRAITTPQVATGPTGRTFRMGGSTPDAAGLQVTHCLRPIMTAMAPLPPGLSDGELKAHIVERFQQHVPLHRTAVLFLCSEAALESQS